MGKRSIAPADCRPGYHCLECRYKRCIRQSTWELDIPTPEESLMILCAKLPRKREDIKKSRAQKTLGKRKNI